VGTSFLVLASQSPRRRALLAESGRAFGVLPVPEATEVTPRRSGDLVLPAIRNALAKARAAAALLAEKKEESRKARAFCTEPVAPAPLSTGPFGFERPGDGASVSDSDDVGHSAASRREVFSSAVDMLTAARHVIIGCDTIACVPVGDGSGEYEILGKPIDRADARRMLHLLSGSEHLVISGLALIALPSGKEITASETTVLTMDRLSSATIEDYLESGRWQGKAGAFGYQDGIKWLHRKSGSVSNIVGLPMELLSHLLDELEAKDL
jgi:septum formation protein